MASATSEYGDRLKGRAVKISADTKRSTGNAVAALRAQTHQSLSRVNATTAFLWSAKTDELKQCLAHGTTAKEKTKVLSEWFNVLLAGRGFSLGLDRWIRDVSASGRASIYDRAMDATYIQTHVGGGYHRLFDGGHDPAGAWKACREAGGDSLPEDISGYLHALWKDLATPMGLPLTTLDKTSFDALATSLHDHFGISRLWLADAVSITASELIGDVAGILAAALNWQAEDRSKFAGLIGSFGVSSLAGGNPLLSVVALVCLARSYQQSRLAGGQRVLFTAIIRGGLGSGTMLAAMSLLAGPAWVGMMTGLCCSILARRCYEHAEKAAGEIDWRETSDFVVATILRYLPGVMKCTEDIQAVT